MPIETNRPRPIFDAGRAPASGTNPSAQPASDVWGVGKKTAALLQEKLRLDPTATPTVADFAYADLDSFALGSGQRELLVGQQHHLINVLHVAPEEASSPAAAALLEQMGKAIDGAMAKIASNASNAPPSKDFVQRAITDFASSIGMNYGVYGAVAVSTQDELTKASALGMKLEPGAVALTVRRRLSGDGASEPGAVVVAFQPRSLLAPVLVTMLDGSNQHSFTIARDVKPVRGFVVEEPTDSFAKLKSIEAQARDSAASVWIDKDPAARRARLEAFGAKVEELAAAIQSAAPSAHHAASLHGALNALRSIHEISAKHIDS
jgi:hypothetical protein